MITRQTLADRADQIDRRLGPIPGGDADAIARELRAAASVIADLLAALKAVLAAPITGERGTAESLAHAAIAKAEGRVSCEAVSA